MARKPKKVNIQNELIESDFILLEALANGNLYVDPANSSMLVQEGLAEINPNEKQGINNLTRITDKGKDFIMARKTTIKSETAVNPVVNAFAMGSFDEIASRVVAKEKAKGRGRKATYPFETLAPNGYFKVEPSEKMPDPVKSLAGTVAIANKRYSEPTGETKIVSRKAKGAEIATEKTIPVMRATRKYEIKQIEGDNSAYIVRTM